MYCPRCGQQQVSDQTRFCSKCGFLLDGVSAILATGGPLPLLPGGPKQLSPRSKGIRQGALLMLSTILLVPLISIISIFILGSPEVLIPLTAILCFVGGLFRILYAVMMEDGAASPSFEPTAAYAPTPQIAQPAYHAALPPPPATAGTWRRPNTAEIYQPPSVTENTTRLLNKEDNETR